MRSRTPLAIALCLLLVAVAVPTSAAEIEREGGRARFELATLWSGLAAWISQYGLVAGPGGTALGAHPSGALGELAGADSGVTPPGDMPFYGLDADPNG